MTDSNIFSDIFKNYNAAIQAKCEESLGTVKSFNDYEVLINEARVKWEETCILDKKPSQYFSELTTEEDVSNVFEAAAVICDEFIPESFVRQILGTGHIKQIEKYAFNDSEIDLKNADIKILGISGRTEYVHSLIGLLYIESEYGELIRETARQALIDIGEPAVSFIEAKLNSKDLLCDDDFHLVIALIGIDPDKKSDDIFRILKESFRKTSDKALAARCLSDYGDGRAVPMLRSYLERNLKKLNEDTVLEIQGAVVKLGGSTDDITGL